MNKKIVIGVGLIVVALIAFFIGYKQFNKPHADVSKSKAVYTLTADSLLNAYIENENLADEKFANQIIQIHGKVSSVERNSTNVIVNLQTEDIESGVSCYFDSESKLDVIEQQQITLKGICTGYLLDVILIDCVKSK